MDNLEKLKTRRRQAKQKNTTRYALETTMHKIKVITKLPNSEQSYKGKVKTHNYITRQNQLTTGKLWKP